MLAYPVILQPDTNGTLLVHFPDIPEAHTFGEDEDEALARAADALEAALSLYIDLRKPIPSPARPKRRQKSVLLSTLAEAKVRLYSLMRETGIGKAELARRLNVHLPQVDRMLDLDHASRIDQLEAAFKALGKRLRLEIEDAA